MLNKIMQLNQKLKDNNFLTFIVYLNLARLLIYLLKFILVSTLALDTESLVFNMRKILKHYRQKFIS